MNENEQAPGENGDRFLHLDPAAAEFPADGKFVLDNRKVTHDVTRYVGRVQVPQMLNLEVGDFESSSESEHSKSLVYDRN